MHAVFSDALASTIRSRPQLLGEIKLDGLYS
jgi:hypothetical protein